MFNTVGNNDGIVNTVLSSNYKQGSLWNSNWNSFPIPIPIDYLDIGYTIYTYIAKRYVGESPIHTRTSYNLTKESSSVLTIHLDILWYKLDYVLLLVLLRMITEIILYKYMMSTYALVN